MYYYYFIGIIYIYMLCTLICSNCLVIACFCIPTIVIFLGMDIHKQQLFWGEQKGISRFDPQKTLSLHTWYYHFQTYGGFLKWRVPRKSSKSLDHSIVETTYGDFGVQHDFRNPTDFTQNVSMLHPCRVRHLFAALLTELRSGMRPCWRLLVRCIWTPSLRKGLRAYTPIDCYLNGKNMEKCASRPQP